ncbi:MAG: glycoside hydrolase family 127 protein, partial [Gemmatimonadetes bacterium]|nr:glycoside hydrolase family 127 protein [Gemmatimonadota bacterium]
MAGAAADEPASAPPRTSPALEMERRLTKAQPVPLGMVRLTGGPLKKAQEVTAQYLLALDPDRMMAFYRERAGLPPKAEGYTGWDGPKRNLTGHIAGHHLSGVSLMYQATGDVRFKQRADYLVREMAEVQRKNGDGYLGALEGLREAFARVSRGEIKSGGFDLNGLWSPWYTLHKTFAGLRDAYRHAGNAQALQVEVAFAAWAEGVVAPLSDAQMQQMLLTEFGGMEEVFADLYADTGNARWLRLSRRFEHHAITEPLKRHQDNLSGKHGNCQIPKLIASASRYAYTGEMDDIVAASFFWDRVVRHHSYASGGHGLNEYWGPPDVLGPRVDGRAAETCNVYNMLKLTRRLFSLRPDAGYADFHERALFNHILAS